MDWQTKLPNGEFLLYLLNLTRQKLLSGSKAAISLPVLVEIVSVAASTLPFDEDFYLSTYEDVRKAHQSGDMPDVKSHFTSQGYLEGRFGCRPDIDEVFYTTTYPDVAAAIARRDVSSALEHYMRAGAMEGRFANAADKDSMTRWLQLGGKL